MRQQEYEQALKDILDKIERLERVNNYRLYTSYEAIEVSLRRVDAAADALIDIEAITRKALNR